MDNRLDQENHRRRALTRLEKTIKPFLIRENLGRPSIAEDLNATGTRRLAVRLRKCKTWVPKQEAASEECLIAATLQRDSLVRGQKRAVGML